MKKFLGAFSCAIYIFIMFAISSCQSDLESSDFINITKQYDVYVTQVLTENGGVGALEFRSIEKHKCENAFLSFQSNIDDNRVEIILNDIEVEGSCIEFPHIVSETIDVRVNNSSKDLIINLKGAVENKGRFASNAKEFELKLESNDGIKINKAQINRVKKDLVWGHFKSNDNATLSELKALFDSVNRQYDIEKGDYGLFYVDQNYEVIERGYGQNALTSFILFSNAQFDEFAAQISGLSENDNSLVFQATNYDGSTLNIQ